VVSDQEIASPIASTPDFVVAMNYPSMTKYQNMVREGGILFLNSDLISQTPTRTDINVVKVPANSLAHEMGNDRALNMIMLGAVNAVTGMVSASAMATAVEIVMTGKKQVLIDKNLKALARGAEFVASGA
jgi:2-oxoglutarate ferredoxin oxidoreductase subunit gamma